MQVFYWQGAGVQQDGKTFYQSFQLNGITYSIGDSVYLFPEQENHPHYIGRIVSAFVDEHSGHADPHCIQVKWYERRVNLEESTRGIEESEREVFELEDVDVNPIGCISGKNYVVKARGYDEAYQRMRDADADWYFCRGYFLQTTNSFQPYAPAELGLPAAAAPGPRAGALDEQDSGAVQSPPAQKGNQNASAGAKRKVTGRVCVQCGATSTPQWREGPTGPKTLCNACGVRYNRAQQKALKRNMQSTAGSSARAQAGGGRGGAGSGSAGGRGKKGAAKEAEGGASRGDHRPVRQAAQAALARTAAYARTGEFPDQEEEPGDNGGYGSQLPIAELDVPGARAAEQGNGTTQELSGGKNGTLPGLAASDIPNFLAMNFPTGGPQGAADGGGGNQAQQGQKNLRVGAGASILSPLDCDCALSHSSETATVAHIMAGSISSCSNSHTSVVAPASGQHADATNPAISAAAVGPAAVCVRDLDQQDPTSSSATVPGQAKDAQGDHAAMLAVNGLPLEAYEGLVAGLDAIPAELKVPPVVQAIQQVRAKADAAYKEVAVAEAAVAAVAQVYHTRIEAAEQARLVAASATEQLKQYVANLTGSCNAVEPMQTM